MTMPCFIVVEPSADGWVIRGDFDGSPLAFPTGARAEHAAREIAHGLADAGTPVVLDIHLRDGARAGRFLFPAHQSDSDRFGMLRA